MPRSERGIFCIGRMGYAGSMEILIAIGLLVVGLVLLIFGAEFLVNGASSIASRLGISPLVIGLTVVAFGTSMPELTVNIYAALSGSTDLAIGNIVGSNIANILLILGVSACIFPLVVKSSTVKWEIPLALLGVLLLLGFGNDILLDGGSQNAITRTDGLALLGLFAVFMFYIFALVKHDPAPVREGEKTEGKPTKLPVSFGLVLLGLGGLVFGGKLLVEQAVDLANLAGMSESVIGLTVVAIGTSLPELATSVVATIRKEADIAVGNVVGSNIFNIFWILGVSSLITPLPASATFNFDLLVAIGATLALLLTVFVGVRGRLDKWQGGIFVVAYAAYLLVVVRGA